MDISQWRNYLQLCDKIDQLINRTDHQIVPNIYSQLRAMLEKVSQKTAKITHCVVVHTINAHCNDLQKKHCGDTSKSAPWITMYIICSYQHNTSYHRELPTIKSYQYVHVVEVHVHVCDTTLVQWKKCGLGCSRAKVEQMLT